MSVQVDGGSGGGRVGQSRTGQTRSGGEADGFFFRRRGGHGFLFGVGIAEIEALRLALGALTLKEGDGAPGVAVKRVAEPTLELSGPVALPDGAGTAFYFLRGQHAAKLGRIGSERKSVSIFEGGQFFSGDSFYIAKRCPYR